MQRISAVGATLRYACRARRILTAPTVEARRAQPDFYDNLDACFVHAWAALKLAPTPNRGAPFAAFRTPILATSDEHGWPQQRVMVLRGVDCKGFDQPVGTESGEQPISVPRLRFHTDRRSPKHKQLLASPRCSVLFYCKASKLQIRVNGIVELEELDKSSDVATAAWRGSSASSRRCYYMEAGPSESTSLERLRTLEDRVLSADAANENATSPHFACLMVDVHQL